MAQASWTAACAARRLPEELLDGAHDCIDNLVLRAYFQLAQDPAGFGRRLPAT
jgi:hypothetical protein